MIGELQDQQQVTAATPAAARQTMPAAGASGELRSQAKNQAFPSFLYSSGISEMSRPGIYTFASCPVKMLRKIFFAENWDFIPKVELSISGRARCLLSHASGTKMAETLVFLREFRSLIGAAGYSSHPSSCHAAHASSRSFRGSRIPSKKSSISVLSNSSGY